MYYKESLSRGLCLECGSRIEYGRSDKIFCSTQCRNKHHNGELSQLRHRRNSIIKVLDMNYHILENLLKHDIASVDVIELGRLGFNTNYATSWRKWRNHIEYACFDIRYYLSSSCIFGIKRSDTVNLRD